MAAQTSENGSSETAVVEAKETRRIVLKQVGRVLVLPDDLTQEQDMAITKAMKDAKVTVALEDAAWVVVGEVEASSKTKAIEHFAGKPGTPDAVPGTYKAPGTSAWRGGEEYVKPPEPLVERKALVD